MNKEVKRWLISSLITFFTGFCMVLVSEIDSIDLKTLHDGTFLGLMFLCTRAGIKAVAELFLLKFNNK